MPTKFNIGDKVKIVDARNCEFGCNTNMVNCIGQTTVITSKKLNYDNITWEYKIMADNGNFTWSANCLKLLIKRKSTVMENE